MFYCRFLHKGLNVRIKRHVIIFVVFEKNMITGKNLNFSSIQKKFLHFWSFGISRSERSPLKAVQLSNLIRQNIIIIFFYYKSNFFIRFLQLLCFSFDNGGFWGWQNMVCVTELVTSRLGFPHLRVSKHFKVFSHF